MGLKETVEKNAVIWFLATLLAGFLAGIGTYEGILRITGQTIVDKGDWDKSHKEIEGLRKKERFLSLFLRYEQAPYSEEKADARDALDEYIEKFIDEADKYESVINVRKGSRKQTTITFPDGSRWIVPSDFRSAVLMR